MDDPKNVVAGYEPIRGVTRQSTAGPVQQQNTRSGQVTSLLLFMAMLVPVLVLVLVYGLGGRGHWIPYSPMWAYGAVVAAVVLTARAAMLRTWTVLGATVVLLLVPAVVVLVMRLRVQHGVGFEDAWSLGWAAIGLYGVAAIALLLGGRRG